MAERVRLLHGDSLKVLPTLAAGSIDAVVTDPPYASGGVKAGERIASTGEKYSVAQRKAAGWRRTSRPDFAGDNLDQRSWMRWCEDWLSECRRLLRPGGYCLSFTDWRQLPALTDSFQRAGLTWRGVLAWDKTEAAHAPKPGYFRRQCEFIVWATHGDVVTRRKSEGGGLFAGAYRCPVRQAEKFHQAGKPVAVMRWLVSCCPPGGKVLDPFAGSASTGGACLEAGRDFLGVEKDPACFADGEARLRAAARGVA